MTTNLHDKTLAAIDAYFSASDAVEEEVAENLLLDVRDEINKHKLAEQPAQQEPVAHINSNGVVHAAGYPWGDKEVLRPLVYGDTTPQPPAQPLTDDKYEALVEDLADWSRYVEIDTAHQSLEKHVREVLTAHGITKGNT